MILISILCTVLLTGILALIKNHINYNIRMKWLDEVFGKPDWFEKQKLFWLYGYNETFLDMKLWKHIPFDEYVKSKQS